MKPNLTDARHTQTVEENEQGGNFKVSNNYAVALSFSKTIGESTTQKIVLKQVNASSQAEAFGKAIDDNWSGGWHLTHYDVITLKCSNACL